MQLSFDAIDLDLRTTLQGLAAGEKPWPLFLHGPAGVGKSSAGLCMLDFAGGRYLTVQSLAELLARSAAGRLDWYREGRGATIWPDQFWRWISCEPLVVLDELGTREKVSDADFDRVKRCIDERQNRPFITISNLGLEEIGQVYDGRIVSRLAAGTIFELAGEDRRLSS